MSDEAAKVFKLAGANTCERSSGRSTAAAAAAESSLTRQISARLQDSIVNTTELKNKYLNPFNMIKKLGIFYFILSHLLLISYSINFTNAEQKDLYSPSDDVLRLNSTSFIPTVFHQNKNTTFVVQFYNTYCGHCQMFAPIYKDLAARLKNWTTIVQIAGVDCSKDENVITCSENKIDGYPTILIFPPNARAQDPKDAPINLRSLNIEWNVDDIEESIVNYLGNLTNTRKELPLVVDALQPLNISSLEEFRRVYLPSAGYDETINEHRDQQDLMFVLESESSYVGRKLIIEYYRIHSRLELRRVVLTNKALINSILTVEDISKLDHDQPVLVRIDLSAGSKAQVLVRGEASTVVPTSSDAEREDFVYNRFKSFLEHYYSIELLEIAMKSEESHRIAAKKFQDQTDQLKEKQNLDLEIQHLFHDDPIASKRIFAMDLLKGISYMITHEIRIKGDLNPSEFSTVRNLLTIILKYLPMSSWDSRMNKFISDLRTNLDKHRATFERVGITGKEMSNLLELSGADEIRLRYSREKWISCSLSDRDHKGYTCSLWLLFHSLTVGEYTRAAPVRTRPTMVLTTMKGYITRFLGCTVCSSNFEKETESLEIGLTVRNSSVLWLWNTHNRVNQRLNLERQTDRKPLSRVIFPGKGLCQSCIKTDVSKLETDGKTLDDVEWAMKNVFSFLIEHYQPERVITPKELATLLNKVAGKVRYDIVTDVNRSAEQWKIQSIFSAGDISLCLFLYLACIVMVAVVCVALNPQWKRYKTK